MIKLEIAVDFNPYPGLLPFEEGQEYLFFGRDDQVDLMVDRLSKRRFLAVVGSSGSGKSSLVACGLKPALRRGQMASAGTAWCMVRFRPGSRPIESLAASLAAAFPQPDDESKTNIAAASFSEADLIATQLRHSRLGLVEVAKQGGIGQATPLLLVVDQFEELFRYRTPSAAEGDRASQSSEPEEALAFVNLLLATTAQTTCPIHIVLTMRSDFFGDCAQFPGLTEEVTASLFLVPRLSRDELREAIAKPALVGGAEIDPALVTRLVNDAGDDPDQLSLLQHALRRSWDRWQKEPGGQKRITLEHYRGVGGLVKALNNHADEALRACPTPGGHANANKSEDNTKATLLVSRMFKALTGKDSEQRLIRRPTRLGDLKKICGCDSSEIKVLVDYFSRPDIAFLRPLDKDVNDETWVDISHESLMRKWGELREWIDKEEKDADQFMSLAKAAQQHKRQEIAYWNDPQLQFALDWRERAQPTDDWALRYIKNIDKNKAGDDVRQAFKFLDESRDHRNKIKAFRVIVLAVTVIWAVLTSYGFWFSRKQFQETRLSRARAYAATAAATLEQRPLQSMLYSLAALERLAEDRAEALGAYAILARATSRNWELARWDINRNGADRYGISALLALKIGKRQAITATGCAHSSPQNDRKDGRCLLQWSDSKPAGQPQPTGHDGRHQDVTALLELADGRIVSGGTDGTLRLWQLKPTLQPLTPPKSFSGNAAGVKSPAIHSLVQVSESEIVSGEEDGGLRRWRLVGQGQESRLEPLGEPVATDMFNIKLLKLPNGALLSGGADRRDEPGGASLQVWSQGKPIGPPLRTGQQVVKQLLLWNDQVLSLGTEGTVLRLNPTTGTSQFITDSGDNSRPPTSTNQHAMGKPDVERLAVVASGRNLVSLHRDGTLRLWQVKGDPATTGGVELLAEGRAFSNDLRWLQALPAGELLAADTNNQLLLIHAPDPSKGELERTGALTSGQKPVDSLLAMSEDRLVSGHGETGKLCFWKLGQQPKKLSVRLKGASGPCLSGTLPVSGADPRPSQISLAPLPNGALPNVALLSATNLHRDGGGEAGMNSVLVQRWQPSRGRQPGEWTVERLATPRSWNSITALSPAGGADVLVLGEEQPRSATSPPQSSTTAKLWRWDPLQPASPPRPLQSAGTTGFATTWLAAAPSGDAWFTGSIASGAVQRWRFQGPNSLQPSGSPIETGLEAISALAVLPGGRYAVIAAGQQSQQVGQVQVFDLREATWVGQPISVLRPLGNTSENVAASALAILPEGGLAIGTNKNPAQLLVIQPRWILEEACNKIKPRLDDWEAKRRGSAWNHRIGLPPAVIDLALNACREHKHR